jgi:quercetin dioxygenase-like cupin family protein
MCQSPTIATVITNAPFRAWKKKEKRMITARLNGLELLEVWAEEDSETRFRLAPAISSESPTASTQLIYFTLEPGERVGRHAHSAEETMLVLEGTVEQSVGDEQQQLSAGEVAFKPAGTFHDERNVGSQTLRCVAFFTSAAILHTWEVPLMPMGSRGFVTPPPEADGAEAAPVDDDAAV